MTPSKKLVIAVTLLALGYGLATLLGTPESRYQSGVLRLVGSSSSSNRMLPPESTAATAAPNTVGSVRLLPDVETASAGVSRGVSRTVDPPATKESALVAQPPAGAEQARNPPAAAGPNPPMRLLESRLELRATLRDEAPRALPDPRTPKRHVDRGHVETSAFAQPMPATHSDEINHVWPVGFTPSGAESDAANRALGPAQPQAAALAPQFSPPPWPMTELEPPRTHVVVDGDSLAKLAGRYLEDPRRSEEIFALNQGILADPEILPIGAELKIPARGSSGRSKNSLPQSLPGSSPQLHSAAHQGLVPVRPIPTTLEMTPRAELLRPRPVE